MIGHNRSSRIVQDIYDIMADYEEGIDLFSYEAVDAIADYCQDCFISDRYEICCNEWPDETGGCCAIAIVDDGYPFLVMFDYTYKY